LYAIIDRLAKYGNHASADEGCQNCRIGRLVLPFGSRVICP